MSTPEPVEGWVFFQDDPVKYPAWTARCPHDSEITVYIAGGHFCFSDDTQYYPGGGVDVPLAVMWKLIELNDLRQP